MWKYNVTLNKDINIKSFYILHRKSKVQQQTYSYHEIIQQLSVHVLGNLPRKWEEIDLLSACIYKKKERLDSI